MLTTSLKILNTPVIRFSEGDTIIKEGDTGSKVYVLLKGSVTVSRQNMPIASIDTSGEVFGEIATVLGKNYGATVTAAGESTLFIIDNFQTFIRQNPDESWAIIRMLCSRIDQTTNKLLSIG